MPLAIVCEWIIGTILFLFSYSPNKVNGYNMYAVVCKGGSFGGAQVDLVGYTTNCCF
jgi:hypothetical protein